ncbi:hypothetical protein Pla108_27110 [Botrimarina colliarenosi]|uniref:Uncharacterized protein n=1 Tax=Botrimarina colliarenosi TaxID=2528001 RepID=A0A5C6ACQ2_9BACT|nr:hypothetical protein Pla108_27110 [Botrimarina colliarenosi]
MIVESAFSILPESIAGLGFQRVKREANAVGSFSFSLLNALHSKNVVDPIQRLQLEKPYDTRNAPLPVNNRHCDIFVDYGGSKIGSKRLANFGWRYRNYVEAKFLKSYRRTPSGKDTRASQVSAEVVADLIRLVALVPEPDCYACSHRPSTSTARYFLVVSDYPLRIFINNYLTLLQSTFDNPLKRARIPLDLTSSPARTAFAERVGNGFAAINLDLTQCTCFSHFPLDPNQPNSCWMLLIRIDSAIISLNLPGAFHKYQINLDRTLVEQSPGDYRIIRDFVASNVK